MGMAQPQRKTVIQTRYKGTVVCQNCEAEYTPSTGWVNVRYHPGTTGKYDILGRIPWNVCPLCKTKREE